MTQEDFKSAFMRGQIMGFDEGRKHERQSLDVWLERIRTWNPTKSADYREGWLAAEARIIGLLQIGGPIETIICDYWGDPKFDKDDALILIEKAIKEESK